MLHLVLSTLLTLLEFLFTRRMLSYCGTITYLTYVLTNKFNIICIVYVSTYINVGHNKYRFLYVRQLTKIKKSQDD